MGTGPAPRFFLKVVRGSKSSSAEAPTHTGSERAEGRCTGVDPAGVWESQRVWEGKRRVRVGTGSRGPGAQEERRTALSEVEESEVVGVGLEKRRTSEPRALWRADAPPPSRLPPWRGLAEGPVRSSAHRPRGGGGEGFRRSASPRRSELGSRVGGGECREPQVLLLVVASADEVAARPRSFHLTQGPSTRRLSGGGSGPDARRSGHWGENTQEGPGLAFRTLPAAWWGPPSSVRLGFRGGGVFASLRRKRRYRVSGHRQVHGPYVHSFASGGGGGCTDEPSGHAGATTRGRCSLPGSRGDSRPGQWYRSTGPSSRPPQRTTHPIHHEKRPFRSALTSRVDPPLTPANPHIFIRSRCLWTRTTRTVPTPTPPPWIGPSLPSRNLKHPILRSSLTGCGGWGLCVSSTPPRCGPHRRRRRT